MRKAKNICIQKTKRCWKETRRYRKKQATCSVTTTTIIFRNTWKSTSSTTSTNTSYTNQGSQNRSWWRPMGGKILIICNKLFWGLLLITLENINILIYSTEMLLVIFKIKNGYFQNLLSKEQEIFSSHVIGFTVWWWRVRRRIKFLGPKSSPVWTIHNSSSWWPQIVS